MVVDNVDVSNGRAVVCATLYDNTTGSDEPIGQVQLGLAVVLGEDTFMIDDNSPRDH